MEEAGFNCGTDLFIEFEIVVEDDAKVFCIGMDIGGEGAQGVGGGCGVVSKDNDFGFIAV